MKKIKFISFILVLTMLVGSLSLQIGATQYEYEYEDETGIQECEESSEEYTQEFDEEYESEFDNEISGSIELGNMASGAVSPAVIDPPIFELPTVITDGVYAIKNVQYSTRYMFVDDSLSPREGLYLKQSVMTTSPTSSFDRAYLFKISRVGTTSRYIIRSMLTNTLSLSVSGNNLVTKIIPDRDEDVPIEDTFYISVFEDGYHIMQYESSGVISIDTGTPENLILDTGKISETQSQWLFERYTGTQRSSSTMYRPTSWTSTGIVVGTTRAVSFIYYSTVVNANIFNVEVAPGYEDIATVSWNPSTRKATITTLNPGRLRINVQIKASDNSTVINSGYYYYNVVPEEGLYYIQNVGTNKYVEIESASTAEGGIVQQWALHSMAHMKWVLEHVPNSNGYVRMLCYNSGLYLGIDSSNTSLVKQYSTENDYTLWKIERSTAGNLVFKCKVTESNEMVMSVPLDNGANGADLVNIAYTSDTNYRDEWTTQKYNNDAIIIIPGIMGTELVAGPNNNSYDEGTKLWSTSVVNDFFSDANGIASSVAKVSSLACDSSGESINDVVPYNNTYGVNNLYEDLYDYLETEYGDRYSIDFFAYDWRMSNSISATELNEYINSKYYDSVVLVCHSMGGLVASKYLSLGVSQRSKIEKVIMLGTPILGTPNMPYLWGTENVEILGYSIPDDFVLLFKYIAGHHNIIDLLLQNFKSLYEMFPSKKYFDDSYVGKTYLVTSILGSMDLEITTYDDTKERLSSYLPFYNSNHMNSAEAFHDSLYLGSSHVTELVTTYYIAGCNVDTTDKIEFNSSYWSEYASTSLGDSLVPTWSATLGDHSPYNTFYANGTGHSGLVINSEMIRFVAQLIDDNTSLASYNILSADEPQN